MLILDIASLLHCVKERINGHYIMRTFDMDYTQFKSIFNRNPHVDRWLIIAIYDLYLFKWMHDNDKIIRGKNYSAAVIYDAFTACLRCGNLNVAKFMYEHALLYELDGTDIIHYSMQSSNIERVKWVHKNISTYLKNMVHSYENIEIAQWLYDTYPTRYHPNSIKLATDNGRVAYIEWYCDTYGNKHMSYVNLVLISVVNFKSFKYLYDRYGGDITQIIERACGEYAFKTIIWLSVNFPNNPYLLRYLEID